MLLEFLWEACWVCRLLLITAYFLGDILFGWFIGFGLFVFLFPLLVLDLLDCYAPLSVLLCSPIPFMACILFMDEAVIFSSSFSFLYNIPWRIFYTGMIVINTLICVYLKMSQFRYLLGKTVFLDTAFSAWSYLLLELGLSFHAFLDFKASDKSLRLFWYSHLCMWVSV